MNKEVKDYFDRFDGEELARLHKIRELVFSLVPDAQETIKYGIPTFIYNGNLLHYAAFKDHIGFYPIPSGIEAFKKKLAKYKHGKGSLQFPFNEELPLKLIKEIVVFRIAENKSKKK